MSATVHFIGPAVPHEPETDPPHPERQPFTFDMMQSSTDGMVLIDACVPAAMATVFLQMLIAFQCEAAAKAIQALTPI